MKDKQEIITIEVSAKYNKGQGVLFNIGSFLVIVGTKLMKRKVTLYATSGDDKKKIGIVEYSRPS